MRQAHTLRFLETVQKGSYESAFEAFLFSCGSVSSLKRNLRNVRSSAPSEFNKENKAQQRFRVMMHRLRKDGLIENTAEGIGVRITKKAKKLLTETLTKSGVTFPERNYTKEKSHTITLILFDIPERYRKKREWLRGALRMLGFELLQRSAWIGSVGVPKQFLKDIRDMKINEYVDIVSIAKSGTIRRINV